MDFVPTRLWFRRHPKRVPRRELDLWLPARSVLTPPELHGRVVIADLSVGRIAVQGTAGAVRNVAQMAKQRAPVSLSDFRVQFQVPTATNRTDEVLDMLTLSDVRVSMFVSDLVSTVIDTVAAVAFQR